MTAVSRETHAVELVDADGVPIGAATVDEAHRAPGRLHRAFSVFLRDPDGRVLLQQRAAVKTRFPLRWANTCCGHPLPGEPVTVAAARRLVEEVGAGGVVLTEVGRYSYYAEDPASGRVEYEYDHVLLGDVPAGIDLLPDPDEVADLRWVTVAELLRALTDEPRSYAPWLAGVTDRLAAHLASAAGSAGGPSAGTSATGPTAGTTAAAAGGTSAGGTSAGRTSADGTSPGRTCPGRTSAGGTSAGGTSAGGTSAGGTTASGIDAPGRPGDR
jgi:isopentenyl-diphosphate delta-isomerase